MLRGAGTRGVPEIPVGSSFTNTYSCDFDGINDSVNLGTTVSALRPTDAFSISLWANWDASTLSGLQGLWECGSNTGHMIWSNGSSGLTFYIRNASSTWIPATANTVTLVADQWYHVVGTWDGSGTSKIYVDGGEKKTASVTSIQYAATTNHNIGKYIGYEFNGMIDEVSFWSKELSSGEITSIYNSGTPTDLASESGLVGWWRMGDGATFPTIPDDSTNSNNGTMTNMVAGDIVTDVP